MIKTLRTIVWCIIIVCLGITWLPYFNILNSAELIAKIPEPLAVTLAANIILTICNILLYPLYFRPFFKKLAASKIMEGANE